ncbi:hypothetical protein BH24ACT12_BH24ACT12_04520 [soil metagenome]|jgi:hypothetical protein
MDASRFRRPAMPGRAIFDALPTDDDPATRAETGARIARLLVAGARSSTDKHVVERVVAMADEHGLDLLADLWREAAADTLAGALWRLYLLRAGVRAAPSQVAAEFESGRHHAPVAEIVAGVVEPPGPGEVSELADAVLRGVVTGDLAVTLDRAAAFARVVSIGRAHLADSDEAVRHAARLVRTAEQLEHAATLERAGALA